MIRLKSLDPPESSSTPDPSNDAPPQESTASASQPQTTPSSNKVPVPEVSEDIPASIEVQERYVWSENFTIVLEKLLSPPVMDKLKQMYEQGPEQPFVSDSGWGSRQAKQEKSEIAEEESPGEITSRGGRGRGRGGRGGRGRDRGGRAGKREDNRRVVTEVCTFSLYIYVAKRGT